MSVIEWNGRQIKTTRLSLRVKIALVVAVVSMMAGSVALNVMVTRYISRPTPPTHTAFVIAIDAYPLAEGGDAYIVRYTLDGAYHAPDFRRHEDVGVFIEHLKKIATVEGLIDV